MPEPQAAPPSYPTADHVQKGPPDPAKDPERARAEKWCRVFAVVPVKRTLRDGAIACDFTVKGPLSIPMAVRRKGTDLGSRDAWIFFTHPYGVFHRDAVFWNGPRPHKGVLEARLSARTPAGFMLYDEVGAGFAAETVPATYAAALGVLRARVLGEGSHEAEYARDLMRLDLDLLQLFRLLTLCLKTRSPLNALAEIDGLLRHPNVAQFTTEVFDNGDRAVIRQFGTLRSTGTFTEATTRFWVDEQHFTKYADVKDGSGRQLILELIGQWKAFEAEHGEKVERLGLEIGTCDQRAKQLTAEIEREKDASADENKLTRFLTRRNKVMEKLDAERKAVLERKAALEAEYETIPGYDRVRGLSARLDGFKRAIDGVTRLGANVFDHNVSQQQIKALDELLTKKIELGVGDEPRAAYKQYDMRLRAEVFPRILMAYSISSYVIRRPESLGQTTGSLRNIKRINGMALDLLDYFRGSKIGEKTLGQVYDETWGQINTLEARL